MTDIQWKDNVFLFGFCVISVTVGIALGLAFCLAVF